MARPSSTFYYEANVHTSTSILHIPIFALHMGDNDSEPWHSGIVRNDIEFKNLFERINRQVKVYIVIPTIFLMNFPKQQAYSKLVINGWKPAYKSEYRQGASISLRLDDVQVANTVPIHAKLLPAPPPVQQRHLESAYGTAMYRNTEVELAVGDADVQI
ncbi:MAG: hypothetical protein H7070_01025 [Saprospiraceae bacterium]|nr:hypothetical protein [Pyrinomonadaceae bacterium]